MKRILFVCAGNICRSPLAEGLFLHKIKSKGLEDQFKVDSAGTGAWHVGERPDARSIQVAKDHGVELPGHSRQFKTQDFQVFDLILAMDKANFQDLKNLAQGDEANKIKMMREFDEGESKGTSVPDPYYGGAQGFELMYEMLDICCENLLTELAKDLK